MKIHSYGKKLMAVACSVVMLVSCMVFAPASAASAQDYYYQFGGTNKWNVDETSYHTSYWSKDSNAPKELNSGKASAKIVEATDNPTGSDYAMEMTYGADLAATTNKQSFSVFSLPNTTGAAHDGRNPGQTIHLLKDITYKITVRYKVVNFISAADLYVAIGMGNLEDGEVSKDTKGVKELPSNNAVLANITEATDGWVTSTGYFTNAAQNGAYIVLKMRDDTSRAGTNVQIGSITIEPVDRVDYTIDLNYTGASVSTVKAVPGQSIADVVADPTRGGNHNFLGWFDAAENGTQVTEFPAESATLYAHWDGEEGTWYTVTFHANPGKLTGDATAVYEAGSAITMTDPVRPGWEFAGWYDDAEAGTEIETVTGDIDAYAHWNKVGTVAEIDGLQSFETASIDDLTFNSKRTLELTTEENHTFAGETSLKRNIVMGDNGQRTRPRLLLGDVTPGKSYTVSFWVKSAKAEPGTGCNFKFYLATYDKSTLAEKISAETWSATGNVDTHTLQSLSNQNRGDLSTDNNIQSAQLSDYLPTEWTQYTVTIDSVTAHKDAAENCLVLGYTDNNSAADKNDPNKKWTNTLYIDDIQIVETDTLADVHTYETIPVKQYNYNEGVTGQLTGTGKGREVTEEVMNHSFGLGGVGHTAKVTLHYTKDGKEQWAYNSFSDCITALYNADATIRKVTPGNTYLVSAWLYSATETTVEVRLYTAGSAGSWLVNPNETIATKQVALAAHTWTQVTLAGAVPTKTTDGKTCQYLALAFANTAENGEAGATEAVYVDDTKVQELGALEEFSGNVALYVNGTDARYDGQHGALRLLGGYKIADAQYDKATINGVTYTVKQRGIILANESQTNLSLFSKEGENCIKISTAKKLAEVCWTESEAKDFITYSLLLKGFSKATADTKYNFRPYVTVDVDGEEVTFYGKLSTVSWNAAVEQYESANGVTLDKDLVE